MAQSVSSVEVSKSFGRISRRALESPVTITHHGHESLVLMSHAEFQRLKSRDRKVLALGDVSDEDRDAIAASREGDEAADFDREDDQQCERDENATGFWNLNPADRAQLARLCNEIRAMGTMANSGTDLIAVGEAIEVIEIILEGEQAPEVSVSIAVGYRKGDDFGEEGLFVGIRVEIDRIVLDELRTRYESGVGSDNSSRLFARLTTSGAFPDRGIDEWIAAVRDIRDDHAARLTTSRDHV